MSILKKPYEITVWDDIWDSAKKKFVEEKVCTIGSDKMTTQNRALNPKLTRNANGSKKFSFQMYHQYIDTITGEKTKNVFSDLLTNERKVKLQYDGQWYDFLVKSVNKTSTNYLYNYELVDAFVNELSKNGFNVVLDTSIENNLGTPKELAEKVLVDTDWKVKSDNFIEIQEEALVHIAFVPNEWPDGFKCYKVTKLANEETGLEELLEEEVNFSGNAAMNGLAFYSCCKNKPIRFQFLYNSFEGKQNYYTINDSRIIQEDCSYYIDILNKNDYEEKRGNDGGLTGFYLPKGFELAEHTVTANDNQYPTPVFGVVSVKNIDKKEESYTDYTETTRLSTHCRGNRYAYSQKTIYSPKLDRYVKYYTKTENGREVEYVGYMDTEILAPNLITNLISNDSFKGTSGWTGTVYSWSNTIEDDDRAAIKEIKTQVESVQGRWVNNKFSNIVDELLTSTYNPLNEYKSYLKVKFNQKRTIKSNDYFSVLLNSGLYDNRKVLNTLTDYDQFVIRLKAYNYKGELINPNALKYWWNDCGYNTNIGWYNDDEETGAFKEEYKPEWILEDDTYYAIITYHGESYTEKELPNKKLRFFVGSENELEMYIETFQLYRYHRMEGKPYMPLDAQNTSTTKIEKYYYINEEELDEATDIKDLLNSPSESLDFNYKPVFYDNAESHRLVSAKESNYFNILQSIAETFQAWLDIKVVRDGLGKPIEKYICFRKYIGEENYAGFKYGVNLKGITRQDNSNNLTTKLIVKNNANQYADNGFCSIQRANENLTRENTIYNFDYYIHQDLLDEEEYLNYTERLRFAPLGAVEESIDGHKLEDYYSDLGENGYYNYLGQLNKKIIDNNEALIEKQAAMTQLNSDIQIASLAIEAAKEESEKAQEEFKQKYGREYYDIQPISTNEENYPASKFSTKAEPKIDNVANSSTEKTIIFSQKNNVIPSNIITFCLAPYVNEAYDATNEQWFILSPYGGVKLNQGGNYFAQPFEGITVQEKGYNTFGDYKFEVTGVKNNGYFAITKWGEIFQKWEEANFTSDLLEENAIRKVVIDLDVTEGAIYNYLNPQNNQIGLHLHIYLRLEKQGIYAQPILNKSEDLGQSIQIALGTGIWLKNDADQNQDTKDYYYEFSGNSTIMEFQSTNIENYSQFVGNSFLPLGVQPSERKVTTDGNGNVILNNLIEKESDRGFTVVAMSQGENILQTSGDIKIKAKLEPTKNYNIYYNIPHYVSLPITTTMTNFRKQKITYNYTIRSDEIYASKLPKYKIEFEYDGTSTPMYKSEWEKFLQTIKIYAEDKILCSGMEGDSNYPSNIKIDTDNITVNNTDQDITTSITPTLELDLSREQLEEKSKKGLNLEVYSAHYFRFPLDTSDPKIQADITEITISNGTVSDNEEKLGHYNEEEYEDSGLLLEQHILQEEIDTLNIKNDLLKKEKQRINKDFYSKYSRFIQEGTWIDETYTDDQKYYNDSLSVLYNSCYPQVSYTINVLELSQLPGYEVFRFELGDTTFVEDPDFFGEDKSAEVAITETINNLDAPNSDTVKVQNFKNQFQDLFQKITATTQQVQYSSGSYDKAGSLAAGNEKQVTDLVTGSIENVADLIKNAGRQSVDWESGLGIVITDKTKPSEQLRLTGGAILFGSQDENGEHTWNTGLTSKGISASMIRAGQIDADKISIMANSMPTFRWDAFGLNAYATSTVNDSVSTIEFKKFVRFDKYGVYGADFPPEGLKIGDKTIDDGAQWHPNNVQEINNNATFSLTWEGLKVTGDEGVVALLGKTADGILSIKKGDREIFGVSNNGNGTFAGELNVGKDANKNLLVYQDDAAIGSTEYARSRYKLTSELSSEKSYYLSATVNLPQGCNFDKFSVILSNGQNSDTISSVPTDFTLIDDRICGPIKISDILGGSDVKVFSHLEIYKGNGGKSTNSDITFTNVKLEEGTEFTGNFSWKFSPIEGMFMYKGDQSTAALFQIDSSGLAFGNNGGANGFSWKFSPTEGMFMWDGAQENNEDALFKIWTNPTTNTKELSMKGHIEAESGYFGTINKATTGSGYASDESFVGLKVVTDDSQDIVGVQINTFSVGTNKIYPRAVTFPAQTSYWNNLNKDDSTLSKGIMNITSSNFQELLGTAYGMDRIEFCKRRHKEVDGQWKYVWDTDYLILNDYQNGYSTGLKISDYEQDNYINISNSALIFVGEEIKFNGNVKFYLNKNWYQLGIDANGNLTLTLET